MEKTKGIFLVAFGKRGYAYSAYNLAMSIKFYNPNLPITLFHDDSISKWLNGRTHIFDTMIPIPDEIKYDNRGRLYPAQIKTSVYKYLQYDYNLFLDVDSLAMQDVTPVIDDLIEQGDYYNTILFAEHNYKTQGREIGAMIWAWADEIWERYNLPEDANMPCVQSSLQFIKKCSESEELFKQIQENLANPIPIENLRKQWGASQPDELYINIAMCQKGVNGKMKKSYVWFTNGHDARSVWQLQKEFPILGLFGNSHMIRKRYTDFYDKEMIRIMRRWGMNHDFKFYYIKADKHANIRETSVSRRVETPAPKVQGAKLSQSDTVKINHTNLIQSYPDERGRPIRPTNYFNCSFIKYNGKTYFAYRMEAKPFCERMKIGLCLMDENLNPIPATNVLLDLYSELEIRYSRIKVHKFPMGFHVEDPRLFIYKDELYLSYTDGYIMGQAKINPETLQAENSFYLEKPDPVNRQTEKNWTFFDYEGRLMCVYDASKQEIFEMSGDKHTKLYETPFENHWRWGQMRGGTSPVRVGDNYLSFFHSASDIKTMKGTGRQYFMGAYMFEGKPPFKPISISKEPLLAGERISDHIPRLSNRIFVVFPAGQIRKENSWLVSYGYNDYECRYVEISDELLKENLIPIKYQEEVLA